MVISKHRRVTGLFVVIAALMALAPLSALAQRGGPGEAAVRQAPEAECTFNVIDGARMDVWELQGDCSTSEAIVLPHATKLDGNGYTIWAVPATEGGVYNGAVITNEEPTENQRVTIYVENVQINATDMTGCRGGDDALRGVWFNGASGGVSNVTIQGLNRFQSGCQEGNGIDVDNQGGTYRTNVRVTNNTILHWQKRGIVAWGMVRVWVTNNFVGESANQEFLGSNGIGIYYGATGEVVNNEVHGNQWFGEADASATGILLYEAENVLVLDNAINPGRNGGNADIGINLHDTHNSRVIRNTVNDNGEDGPHGDIGIRVGCESTGNIVGMNQVSGFDVATNICQSGGRPA